MKLSNLSIGKRLGFGISLLLIFATGAVGYALWSMGDTAAEFRRLAEVQVARERVVQEWAGRINLNLARTLAVIKSNDPALKAYFDPVIKAQTALINTLQKTVEEGSRDDEAKQLMAAIAKQRADYITRRTEVFKLLEAGKRAEADKALEESVTPAVNRYTELVGNLLEMEKKKIDLANGRIQADSAAARQWLLLLGGAALFVSAILGVLLARSITRPLKLALTAAQTVASGDLRTAIAVSGNDELGALLRAIAQMQDDLKKLIGAVQQDVSAVSSSASELMASADELSHSSELQSESVSATAAAIEQLTVSIGQVSESAVLANDVVAETSRVSDQGLAKGATVSREISEIETAVTEFGSQMATLQQQAGNIGTVVRLIRDIADQTNLLALNAAIEAARAGEQGRGFAVVADEVRRLAERTSNATEEIGRTIEGIQKNMASTGGRLETVKTCVTGGVASIRELVEPLQRLQQQAAKAADGLRELTHATHEQKQVSEQIARNTEKIAGSAEQNRASISHSRDAAGRLGELVKGLMNSTARFKLA